MQTCTRDARHIAELRQAGWRIFLIWECGLTKGAQQQSLEWLPDAIRNAILDFLSWPSLQQAT